MKLGYQVVLSVSSLKNYFISFISKWLYPELFKEQAAQSDRGIVISHCNTTWKYNFKEILLLSGNQRCFSSKTGYPTPQCRWRKYTAFVLWQQFLTHISHSSAKELARYVLWRTQKPWNFKISDKYKEYMQDLQCPGMAKATDIRHWSFWHFFLKRSEHFPWFLLSIATQVQGRPDWCRCCARVSRATFTDLLHLTTQQL